MIVAQAVNASTPSVHPSVRPLFVAADLSLPLTDTPTVEAAIRRNAAERRLLTRLRKLCWARDHELGDHAGAEAAPAV